MAIYLIYIAQYSHNKSLVYSNQAFIFIMILIFLTRMIINKAEQSAGDFRYKHTIETQIKNWIK